MMRLVVEAAARLNISCTTAEADVPALARESGESIEEAGRKVRYDFLKSVACESGSRCVAVAHHADDQAETILHRILRGTGLRGLRGMPASRWLDRDAGIRLVRPLLEITRADCIGYLERRGLPWMHDVTNDDIHAALRNRLRHDVMPLLRGAVNPKVAAALTRLARQADDAYSALRDIAADALARARLDGDRDHVRLDAERLRAYPAYVCNEVILAALESIELPQKALRSLHVTAITEALQTPGPPRTFILPAGCAAELNGRELYIRRTSVTNTTSRSVTGRAPSPAAPEGSAS